MDELDLVINNVSFTMAFQEYMQSPHTKEERMQKVGRTLEFSRKRAGLSQKAVCDLIGCKPQTYSGYEKGKYEPTIETLVRLSWLYNITLDYLLCKDENDGDTLYENEIENRVPEDIAEDIQALQHEIEVLKQQMALKQDK